MGNNAAHPAAASYAVCICPVVRFGAMVIHRKGQLCRTSYAVCIILVRRTGNYCTVFDQASVRSFGGFYEFPLMRLQTQ